MKIIINFDLLIPAFSLLIVFNIEIHISISIFYTKCLATNIIKKL